MKKLIICVLILLLAVPAFAGNPCEDALAKYSAKLPNFSCSTKEKNDVIQDRLVQMFKQLAAQRKAEGAKPATANPAKPEEPITTETKSTQSKGYVLQFKNEFKVDW